MTEAIKVDRLIAVYTKIRAVLAAETRAYEERKAELKGQQRTIENALLARSQQQGVDGFKTDAGTAYQAEEMNLSIADDVEFFAYVLQTGDLEFFERRVSMKHVREYQKINDGRLPPGLHAFRELRMRVRKPITRGAKANEENDAED